MSDQLLRFKGRFIKKKKRDIILKKIENLDALRKKRISANKSTDLIKKADEVVVENVCEGRRIIDIKELGKNMKCSKCKQTLSLENITSEKIIGLHSVWMVKCISCHVETKVHTGKSHVTKDDKNYADVNSKAILGVLHTGSGCAALNGLLSCLNIPTINSYIFKKYEDEIGWALEEAAHESCKRAAVEERELMIEKMEKLCCELPPEILDELYPDLETLYMTPAAKENPQKKEKSFDDAVGNIVHIIVSYDMGWSKRGNGKSYDSLNGYGTIIGFLSGKILDYGTRNRKCKKCDNGSNPDDHGCRKNFEGSAKAMEPHLGAALVNNSRVLKSVGLDVRAVVGDDDSSTISAILHGSMHKIFKLSCRVHLSRNFVKGLYKLKKKYSELGRKGVIPHLKKCFSYALAQNSGNAAKMKNCLLSIRDHVYGQHENCGDWCSRNELKKSTITLTNDELYSALYDHLAKYANNTSKFSFAATSQANENFNGIVANRMRKGYCYSLSASADYRVAGAVLSKNEGDKHLMTVEKKLCLSPGKYTAKYATKKDKYRKRKNDEIKLKRTKARRIFLKNKRESLRKRNENKEGVQYQRNCGIDMKELQITAGNFDIDTLNFSRPSEICQVVFFDIETSGFGKCADILQIAAISGNRSFSVYINPKQAVYPKASDVTGLKNIGEQLFFHGKKVLSIPLHDALLAFSQFMNSTPNPTLLVAHNASFDTSHLLRAIQKCSLLDDFCFVAGYIDTLSLLRKKMPDRKGEGMFKLSTLANDLLDIPLDGNFHEALYDVEILEKITSLQLTKLDLFANVQCFFEPLIYPTLAPLKVAISSMMIKRISKRGITYQMMKKEYAEKGKEGLIRLLTEDIGDNTPRVTKNKRTVMKVIEVFQSEAND